jgi:hypothetical protein
MLGYITRLRNRRLALSEIPGYPRWPHRRLHRAQQEATIMAVPRASIIVFPQQNHSPSDKGMQPWSSQLGASTNDNQLQLMMTGAATAPKCQNANPRHCACFHKQCKSEFLAILETSAQTEPSNPAQSQSLLSSRRLKNLQPWQGHYYSIQKEMSVDWIYMIACRNVSSEACRDED